MNNLAVLYQDQGRLAEAEPLLKRALDGSSGCWAWSIPIRFKREQSGCFSIRTRAAMAEAEPLYKRALEARERVLGPEHPDTLTSVNNLAGALQAQGR